MNITAFVLCHKLEKYVDRAIASIVTQSCAPDSIVLVGTDCRDETYAALRFWKGHPSKPEIVMSPTPLTCQRSKRFIGDMFKSCTASTNKETAFFILDADDWVMPRYLERVASYMEQYPEVGAVGCDYQVVRRDGQVLPSAINELSVKQIDVSNPIPACSLTRLSAYADAGGYGDYQYEDWALWVDMTKARHRIFRWPQILYTHLRHGANLTQGQDQMHGKEQILKLLGIPDSSIAGT